jgi:hypothetical protein
VKYQIRLRSHGKTLACPRCAREVAGLLVDDKGRAICFSCALVSTKTTALPA